MRLRLAISFFLLLGFQIVKGQILDDTTKVIYGPTSTRYILEERLYLDLPAYSILDTTLYDQHRISKVEQSRNHLIDLGLEGTTTRHQHYNMFETQGVRPGFEGFAPFVKGPREIRYYDTRSPYSRISAMIGGNNRAATDIQFSRSDSINFNFGFDFYKILNERQLDREGRGDKEVEDTQYDIYAHFKTNNLKYQALVNYSRDRHIYFETGGIDTTATGDFFDDNSSNRLTTAESIQLWRNFHLYHQYMITDWLEVFNINDVGRQINEYKDSDPDPDYYDTFYFSESETNDSVYFDQISIIGGLKGRVKNIHYTGYFRYRNYEFNYKYVENDTIPFDSLYGNQRGEERYYGFLLGYDLPKEHFLFGGMSQLSGKFNNFIELRGPLLNLRWQKMLSKPSFLHQAYIGNHRFWVNNFTDTQADKVTAHINVPIKKMFAISPTVDYTSIRNHIYFDQDTLPNQYGGRIKYVAPGLKFKIDWNDFLVLEGEWIRTIILQDSLNLMRIPKDFLFGRFYYHDFYFKNALEVVFGFEGSYRNPYFAYSYDPVVQQYYLQDHTRIENQLAVNMFMNFRITRATFFLKINNMAELLGGEGYLVAPEYRGLRSGFDFGFNWWFFD